jgi:hypothetical protein
MSTVVEHSINLEHHIQLHNTSVLSTKSRYVGRIFREADRELHLNHTNKEDGLCLSKSWKVLICFLEEHRKLLS